MSARRSPGLGLLAVAVVTASLLFTVQVRAASCSGASHEVSLTNGSVTPGLGTTATVFSFSVVYTSNAACTPTSVQVTVEGVGTVEMSATGTDYAGGVTFRRAMTLPPGSRAYSFRAISGTGAGSRTVQLTNVSPAMVTVLSPTPAPTQAPTPIPPPPPPSTPRPTSPPPPPPTATPLVTALPVPTPIPSATESNDAVAVVPSPPSVGGPGAWGQPGPYPSNSPPQVAPASVPGIPDSSTSLTVWLVATVGGLGLFLLLNRPPRQLGSSSPVRGATLQPMVSDRASPEPHARPTPRQPRGEAQMARWLRPSVQAARHAQPGRYSSVPDGFDED